MLFIFQKKLSMTLQQLRYLLEVEKQHLNISKAAQVLCTSQSGISKQIRLLEQELGIRIFERNGKKISALTDAGCQVLEQAKKAWGHVQDIKMTANEFTEKQKSIVIATTHTQARYVLPGYIEQFLKLNGDININLHQGTPQQVADMLENGEADLAIATEVLASRESLISLPCYQWSRSIICREDHPVASTKEITLDTIASFPVITYVQGFTGRQKQDEVFNQAHLQPNIVLSAFDADIIKTYVRLGLGIGIIADMAYCPEIDQDLQALSVKQLFGISTSYIAIRNDRYLKSYLFPFIELFAPHLTQELMGSMMHCSSLYERQTLLAKIKVPSYSLKTPESAERSISQDW